MSSSAPRASRRVGMVVVLGFLALIAFGLLAREPSAGDRMYLLIRWPLWVLGIVLPPLLLARFLLRRRRCKASAESAESAEPERP